MTIQHCLMPKRIFKVGKMVKKDGSIGDEILYRSYDTGWVYKSGNKWISVSIREDDVNKLRLKHKLIEGIVVPCGRCHYCRLRKAYDRAKQAWCDAEYYKYQYFITITYDDDNLTWMNYCTDDGTIEPIPILNRQEIVDFKETIRDRARKRGYQPIEYMLSGEYGSQTARPHYHMILLTDDPEIDLHLYQAGRSRTGYDMFGSTTLDEIWDKGMIRLSRASVACMAYTARYTLKKSYKGDPDRDRKIALGYPDEFICSTPGIGSRYMQDHLDEILKHPSLQLPGTKGVSLPKYFIDKLERMGYSGWVEQLKQDNIERQKESINYTENLHNMHYDEFVRHQQFKITKKQYEM